MLPQQYAVPPSAHGQQMGTTATLAYFLWPDLYVAHAGDSRCYLLRQSRLHQLTTDHTYADRLRAGGGPEVDADSPWHHMLWNALGGVRNSVLKPEIDRVQLEPWDTVLLCTDGLTKLAKAPKRRLPRFRPSRSIAPLPLSGSRIAAHPSG